MKLNLGCGSDIRPGYKNIDIVPPADEVYDISKGLRESDESVTEIFASCVLEQMPDKHSLKFVLNECWRVLEKNGKLEILVPDIKIGFQDPWDTLHFTKDTFTYFDADADHYRKFGQRYGFKPWHVVEIEISPTGIIKAVLRK